MDRILITPRSLTRDGHPSLDQLKKAGFELLFSTPGKQPTEDELLKLLPGCVGYLAGVEKISVNVLENAKGLRVISRNGSGIDNIDQDSAKRLGIKICKTEGANARGVAELTVGLMFSLVRAIPFHDIKMKDQQWERRKGIELQGRTFGLLGCGKIGKEVALMSCGIGMKVLAYRRNPDLDFLPSDKFKWVSFEELLKSSDIISIHRPAEPDGKPVINKEVLEKMKKGVFIINTSRASLIDEKAILDALNSGQVTGFATDVYYKEPPEEYTLVKHDRVISTPHLGGYTDESVDRATTEAVENLLKELK